MTDRLAHRPRSRAGLVWQVLTLAVVLLAFALRLYYAVEAAAFVDEPTTLLVAGAIADGGLPVLPSGLFYGNDLPFSYLAGAVVALTGTGVEGNLLAVRLLTVGAATLTVLVVAITGRRFFGPWVGLWAALLVALDPEAIVWGGRARAYGILGLFAFGGLALFCVGVLGEERAQSRGLRDNGAHGAQSRGLRYNGARGAQSSGLRYNGARGAQSGGLRRAGLALLVVALFVHPEAALLLPAVAIATTLLHGVRWWLIGKRWVEMAVALAAAAGRYGLQLVLAHGSIGNFQTPTGSRPPVEIAADPLAAVAEIAPFFAGGGRLAWTILALLATVAAVWAWRRGRRGDRTRATIFFCSCLWLVPVGMLLFFGQTYQSPRYLIFLIPVLAVCAAVGLSRALAFWIDPANPSSKSALAALAATLILLAGCLPGGVAAARSREKGFVAAMDYVSEAWQPGDRVATVAPATCHLYLGRCDYFALGIDYEEFVYRDGDGQMVDRWLGTPLVRTAADLEELLRAEGRLWLIVDEGRLRTRFEPAFAQVVWQRMEALIRTDDVLVFRSADEGPAVVVHSVDAQFDDTVALVAYALPGHEAAVRGRDGANAAWGQITARPGEKVPLVLYWQATSPVPHESVVFVHLIGADGERYAQDDGPPLRGVQPMTHWMPGETLPDRRALDLPPDLPPGRYQIRVGLYDGQGGSRRPIAAQTAERVRDNALILDYLVVLDETPVAPVPQVAVDVLFTGAGDEIRLVGYDLGQSSVGAGEELELVLYWQAVQPVSTAYRTFVHLLAAGEEIVSQDDGPALGGFYPSSLWDPGEIVIDRRVVRVDPGVPAGSYQIAVGLYVLDPPRRLQTAEGDRLMLGQVQVTE